MRDELCQIWKSLEDDCLPPSATDLFEKCWDEEQQRFTIQETYVVDFKANAPAKFSDDYGIGILRLAMAFHNTFGGLIIFGVEDQDFTLSGANIALDIEAFNRRLSEIAAKPIECQIKSYTLPGSEHQITVAMVPRRHAVRPCRLAVPLGKYQPGTLWVRDRHEVREAKHWHLPLLHSRRDELPSGDGDQPTLPIHRSLPPSPATMQEFVGRDAGMASLWDWLVFGDQPRFYLHGVGGSGKSTLAHEFARQIADNGFRLSLKDNGYIDYVLFLSAKETELNPFTRKQETFRLRQFSDEESEFRQILFHSGNFDIDVVEKADTDGLLSLLDELFSSYTGLIVLDDIDALSRRKKDTGEEELFYKAVSASNETKILYTLRDQPKHAKRNAFEVPGLNDEEFAQFVETCCVQFGVKPPEPETFPKLAHETRSLPLLIENVVGLRKHCGSFKDAIKLYNEKGGDEARAYLYQREYDALDTRGKSREILAALFLIEEAVEFQTLDNLLPFGSQLIADAIDECGSIFLTTSENDTAQTLYQLSRPAMPFIATVSKNLNRYDQLKRIVDGLRSSGRKATPAETALIIKMQNDLRAGDIDTVIRTAEGLADHDTRLANPMVHAVLGQAYSQKGRGTWERARECFRRAAGMGLRDPHMMRAWYYLEHRSGYGLKVAKEVCELMINGDNVGKRLKSEFRSKLGWCFLEEARALQGVAAVKAAPLFELSIRQYIEALRLIEEVPGMNASETLQWLQRAAESFLRFLKGDVGPYLKAIDAAIAKPKFIDENAAYILMAAITKAYLPNDENSRRKLAGQFEASARKTDKLISDTEKDIGLVTLRDTLEKFSATIAV